MSEEEKYDELIRQKFAEKEFMFNEANWEKAEAMIDSSRKAKKIFWWSAVFLIGLITGIFLMFPLIKNSSSPNNQTKLNAPLMVTDSVSNGSLPDKTTTNEKSTAGNGPSQIPHTGEQVTTENKEGPAEMKNSNSKTVVDEWSVKNNNNPSAKNKSNSSASSDQPQENKFSKVSSEAPDSKDAQQRSKITAPLKAEKSSKKSKIASKEDADPIQSAETNKQLLTQQKNKKGNKTSTSENEKNIYALARERTVIKNAKPHVAKKNSDEKGEIKAEEIKENDNKAEAKKNELAKKDPSAADTGDSTLLESKSAEETVAKIDALNDSVKQEEKKLVVADSVQKSDSAQVAAQDKSITPALDGLAKGTFLSIDGGINGQLGWKNNEVIEGRGVTPIFGLGITHAFNQTWSFSSGVHYTGIGYLKGDSRTSRTTTYDFGSTTTTTTTKPRFLHYIAVPILIQYHFNDKNAILAGGSVSYLLNAKGKVEENATRVGPVIDSVSAQNNSNSDYYTKTFSPFDAAIGIGYRRKLSARFSITGIANFGLLDIKRNSFFLQNTFERNRGLRVILSYTIFDF